MGIIKRYLTDFKKFDLETTFIIIWSSFILLVSLYAGRPKFIWNREPFLGRLLFLGAVYGLSPFIPFFIFRNRPRNYGISFGNLKIWPKDILFYLAVMAVVLVISFKFSRLKVTYPLYYKAKLGLDHFLIYQAVQLFHMIGWEFFFRGFMLFGLSKKMDPKLAILIQTIPFALMHYRKPPLEAYGSIFAGVFQGAIAVQAGSFLPCAILHWLVALAADVIGIIF
jgi:membrane protease YdiL (CAAX protease family)